MERAANRHPLLDHLGHFGLDWSVNLEAPLIR